MDTPPDTQLRVTATERETTISRLQEAYIQGQLREHELGERIDRALAAVNKGDLGTLVADLPAMVRPVTPAAKVPWWRRRAPGESVYKSTVRKGGSWSVPANYRANVYKGMLTLDLRDAVLSSRQLTIELNAYKGRVVIVVPSGFNIDLQVTAYKGHVENLCERGVPDGPSLTILGSAYKGTVVLASSELMLEN